MDFSALVLGAGAPVATIGADKRPASAPRFHITNRSIATKPAVTTTAATISGARPDRQNGLGARLRRLNAGTGAGADTPSSSCASSRVTLSTNAGGASPAGNRVH
jgi:hypothetical protein